MTRTKNLLFSLILLVFAVASLFAPYASVRAANAEDIKPVPLTSRHGPASWFERGKIKFINRSHLKLNFDAGSDNPAFTDGGQEKTFEDIFAGEYIDSDWDGQEINIQYDIEGDNRESRINEFADALNEDIDFNNNNYYDKRIVAATIIDRMRDIEVAIEVNDSFWQDIDASTRVIFTDSGPRFSKWEEQGTDTPDVSKVSVAGLLDQSALDNFNISYAYNEGIDTAISLLGGTEDFVWCSDSGSDGRYIRDDCGGDQFLKVQDGSRAAKKTDMTAINGKQTFKVSDIGGGNEYDTVIAAEDSPGDTSSDGVGSGTGADGGGGGGGRDDDENCDAESGLTWIICGTIRLVRDALDKTGTVIEDLLLTDPKVVQQGNPAYRSWKGFRDLANVGLVLVFIIIIYSQATGGKS